MAPRSLERGTSLVELLVAVVFIGLCVSPIVACVRAGAVQSAYAQHRAAVAATILTTLQSTRAAGRTAALTPGTTVTNPSLGIPGVTPSMTKTISLEAGHADLYRVVVSVSWAEDPRTDVMTVATLVRAPNG